MGLSSASFFDIQRFSLSVSFFFLYALMLIPGLHYLLDRVGGCMRFCAYSRHNAKTKHNLSYVDLGQIFSLQTNNFKMNF